MSILYITSRLLMSGISDPFAVFQFIYESHHKISIRHAVLTFISYVFYSVYLGYVIVLTIVTSTEISYFKCKQIYEAEVQNIITDI